MTGRTPFQGVRQILVFNRRFYAATLAEVSVAAAVTCEVHGLLRLTLCIALAATVAWLLSSLAVSHYVYDRSPLYRFDWLTLQPDVWLNLHAGLDETSVALRERFPRSNGVVWDIFDRQQMTEPSMAVARVYGGTPQAEHVDWRKLPAGERTFEAVFLVFVAHEFRIAEARHEFLAEVARVLKPGGSLVMVEHFRDVPNFLAFGPGFLHFYSRQVWTRALQAARLTVHSEQTITPFVHAIQAQA